MSVSQLFREQPTGHRHFYPLQPLYDAASIRCRVLRLGVHAFLHAFLSLPSVGAYQKYGFELAGEVAESGGLVYQPMEATLPQPLL
ncbi:GNAT family N-acetyltransferase [Pseudoalteromonas rubra]|uniref:GNAT family N-acetyltransferase n=1 Tax=Pseudoalteromonas rubra TaxID=43658 RepID=UPI002015F9B9|nr:GNAT family N-acetyltransferase [Pseudoalteromonas rubra]